MLKNKWLGRLFIFAVLVGALIGANILYGVAAQWQGVQSGAAGTLLYAAAFDGFEDEWDTYEGRLSAKITEGAMRVDVGNELSIPFTAPQAVFADFDARVRATVVGGSEGNDGYGLIFRLNKDRNPCGLDAVLWCGLAELDLLGVPLRLAFDRAEQADQFYMFLISNDGYYSLWRSNAAGQAEKITVWTPSNAIRLGNNVSNQIRVVGRDDQFQFYINDVLVSFCIPDEGNQPTAGIGGECVGGTQTDVWHEPSFATGQIGVVVRTERTVDTAVTFDNFVVLMPADGSENGSNRA